MAQVHLVVVIETSDLSMHVTTLDEGPADINHDVWDADRDQWRPSNAAEVAVLSLAERKLTDAIKAAGLSGEEIEDPCSRCGHSAADHGGGPGEGEFPDQPCDCGCDRWTEEG